jgi:hypothetical protein
MRQSLSISPRRRPPSRDRPSVGWRVNTCREETDHGGNPCQLKRVVHIPMTLIRSQTFLEFGVTHCGESCVSPSVKKCESTLEMKGTGQTPTR